MYVLFGFSNNWILDLDLDSDSDSHIKLGLNHVVLNLGLIKFILFYDISGLTNLRGYWIRILMWEIFLLGILINLDIFLLVKFIGPI